MDEFQLIATFITHPNHHELFRSKDLVVEWARTYPMLFDDDDLRVAENQAHIGYHFYEWLAAVLIYHSFGYLSLIEKYEFKTHPQKQQILRRLAPRQVVDFILHRKGYGRVQCPDLLVYLPDYSDWFFCEVKGPRDKLREDQVNLFNALAEISGKDIRLVEFRYQHI